MGHLRQAIFVALAFLFLLSQTVSGRAAESPAPTTPWTQEKVKPAEVQDKEKKKEEPITTCEKKEKKTGEKYHEVSYQDGTVVRYYPLPPGSWLSSWPRSLTGWVIIIPGPKGKTKITYSFVWYGERGRRKWVSTVEEPGKNPVTEDWKEANEPEKGSWLSPSYSTSLANVAFPGYSAADSISSNFSPSPLLLAATAERPQSQTPRTQEKPPLNLKLVTFGGPLPDPVIHLDPGPPTKPEDFVQNPTPMGWDPPTDSQGPLTGTPGPTGTPVTPIPGGAVSVGSGWAQATVPSSFLADCAGEEEEDDGGRRTTAKPPASQTTKGDDKKSAGDKPADSVLDDLRRGNPMKTPEGTPKVDLRPDGTLVRTWPDGTKEVTLNNGMIEIYTPEGFKVAIINKESDGTIVWKYPTDGSFIEMRARPDGSKIIKWTDGGTTETRPDGTKIETKPDGTRTTTKPDGTKTVEKTR